MVSRYSGAMRIGPGAWSTERASVKLAGSINKVTAGYRDSGIGRGIKDLMKHKKSWEDGWVCHEVDQARCRQGKA